MISLIIPVYKVEPYLRPCLDSILAQTYHDWEAILIDDGSPDNSGAICDEYVAKDSRFKVIHQENSGISCARNMGLSISSGDYVMYLDSDDYLHPSCLEWMFTAAQDFGADLVQSGRIRGEAETFPPVKFKPFRLYDNRTIFIAGKGKVMAQAKLYQRSIIEGIDFPPGIRNEDEWTTWKYYERAHIIAYTDTPLYYYRRTPISFMATQIKNPDFGFLKAYEERINWFVEKGDKTMESCVRLQFCRCLIPYYSNTNLSPEQGPQVRKLALDNAKKVLTLGGVQMFWRFFLLFFLLFPRFTSSMWVRLYN